jgi:hypothetical protein
MKCVTWTLPNEQPASRYHAPDYVLSVSKMFVNRSQLRTYFIESYTQYVQSHSTTRKTYTETEHISFVRIVPTILTATDQQPLNKFCAHRQGHSQGIAALQVCTPRIISEISKFQLWITVNLCISLIRDIAVTRAAQDYSN